MLNKSFKKNWKEEIEKLLKEDYNRHSLRKVSKEYGVSLSTICKYYPEAKHPPKQIPEWKKQAKKLFDERSLTLKEIAQQCGISLTTIYKHFPEEVQRLKKNCQWKGKASELLKNTSLNIAQIAQQRVFKELCQIEKTA